MYVISPTETANIYIYSKKTEKCKCFIRKHSLNAKERSNERIQEKDMRHIENKKNRSNFL